MAAYFAFFAIMHSVLADPRFKSWARKEFGGVFDRWQRLERINRASASGETVTSVFYCHIRNPLFFFAALFLWLSPIMTLNLLAFNILATVYFYIGARHEERSLTEEFGQEYEAYKKRVPMFLPRLKC
jgi:protein-S-isoprenylcysteine O-methyltransferase Ste14